MIYGGYFEVDSKLSEIKSLEEISNSSSFWNNSDRAQEVLKKINYLKEITSDVVSLKNTVNDNLEIISIL